MDLFDLVTPHDLIVVCRVEGILRFAHTPFNSPYAHQTTLYRVHVEQYLKGQGQPQLKVLQNGGPLAWQSNSGTGKIRRGYRTLENPFLLVNARYILFFRDPRLHFPGMEKGYLEHTVNGFKGIGSFSDELLFLYPLHGKILIQNGRTYPADSIENSKSAQRPWRFGRSPEIIGISEAQAIHNIRKVLTDAEAKRAKNRQETLQKLRSKGLIR